MATFPLGLHLHEGDLPGRLQFVVPGDDRPRFAACRQRVNDDSDFVLYGSPRDMRAWAEALVELADEAVRREDALTDVPLFDREAS